MKIYIIFGLCISVIVWMVFYNYHKPIDKNENTQSEASDMKKNESCAKKYIFTVLLDGSDDQVVQGDVAKTIGCNDQLIRIEVENCDVSIEKMILNTVKHRDEQGVYYNSLAMSEISIDRIVLNDSNVDVYLGGQLLIGGMCDAPRVMSQLQETVLQFEDVDSAVFYINGEELGDFLSEKD